MKTRLRNLVELQRLDEQLATLRRRLDSLPAELGERQSRLAALEAEAEAIEGRRKAALLHAQDLETTVLQMEKRVERLAKETRDSRDAGALQVAEHEAGELRDRISKAQEEALRELELAEALAAEAEEARAQVRQAAAGLEQFRTTVAEDEGTLEAEGEELRRRRAALLKEIPSNMRDIYEKLLPSRRGRPLAPLRGESCGGCGMVVPPNDRMHVHGASVLVRCRSCARILVDASLWSDGGEAAAAGGDADGAGKDA